MAISDEAKALDSWVGELAPPKCQWVNCESYETATSHPKGDLWLCRRHMVDRQTRATNGMTGTHQVLPKPTWRRCSASVLPERKNCGRLADYGGYNSNRCHRCVDATLLVHGLARPRGP